MHTHPPGHVLFEKYRIEQTLDVGGQSVVYRARQLGIGREVALKIVRTDQSPKVMDTLIKRFAREAKLLGQLRDPHTITLHDFGTSPDGSLYMVCEYIAGRDLKQVMIEEGAMAPQRVVRILRQMMSPLKEAHAKGILHRDIKPANIMLSQTHDQPDFVKVLDFGIAKIMEETTKLTGINSVVGTPRYIAPEAIRRLELTPAYDIYSAGVIAYNLLTAEHPLADLPIKDLLLEIANGPEYLLPQDLQLPEGLREIVHKMLRKDRRVRYQSAREVIEDLDRIGSAPQATPQDLAPAPSKMPLQPSPLGLAQASTPETVESQLEEASKRRKTTEPQYFSATRQMHAVVPRAPISQTSREELRALPNDLVDAAADGVPEQTKPMQEAMPHGQDARPNHVRPAVEPQGSYGRTIPKGMVEQSSLTAGHSATVTGAHAFVKGPETSKIVVSSGLPSEHRSAASPTIGTLASIGPGIAQSAQRAARSNTIEVGASQYGHLMTPPQTKPTPKPNLMWLAGAIVGAIFLLAVVILVVAILHLSARM